MANIKKVNFSAFSTMAYMAELLRGIYNNDHITLPDYENKAILELLDRFELIENNQRQVSLYSPWEAENE